MLFHFMLLIRSTKNISIKFSLSFFLIIFATNLSAEEDKKAKVLANNKISSPLKNGWRTFKKSLFQLPVLVAKVLKEWLYANLMKYQNLSPM